MRTVFAEGLRDPKMNGAARTLCCNTSVAVGPKFLHAEDVWNICSVGCMLLNFISRSQQEQVDNRSEMDHEGEVYQAPSEFDGHLVFGCIPMSQKILECRVGSVSVGSPQCATLATSVQKVHSKFNP